MEICNRFCFDHTWNADHGRVTSVLYENALTVIGEGVSVILPRPAYFR